MHNKENSNKSSHIPDLDIIDLDQVPLESLEEEAFFESVPSPEEEAFFASAPSSEEQSFPASDRYEQPETAPHKSDLSDSYHDAEEYDDYDEPLSGFQTWFSKAKWHLAFAAAAICIIFLAYNRIMNYGVRDNLNNYEGNYDLENFDNIMPLIEKDGVEPVDDGVTTIVAFGNAPFADDKGSEDNLASMIERKTGATVYNLAVEGSYLAMAGDNLGIDMAEPMDTFNFYWLTTAFCLRNAVLDTYDTVLNAYSDVLPQSGIDAYNTMMSIDFNQVDVIVLMYDGSDYLAGHQMYSDENSTDIYQFTGNMEAGIELIQQTYPHIRIIVMSPTYAFAINEEGDYVSSDQYRYGQDVLSTYVIKQAESSYYREVSFVDNLYGTITEDNATEYLTDNIHLNVQGRELVADRFVYALNYYEK